MALNQHWTLVGLSFLLLVITDLDALASSYHLRGEKNYEDLGSRYNEALHQDIGSTLNLLSYLLVEKDGASQDPGKQPHDLLGDAKEMPHVVEQKNVLQSLSDLNLEQRRKEILTELLQNSQLKTLLKSFGNRKDAADDSNGNDVGSEAVGLESLLRGVPAALSTNSKTDDVIPAATKSKRGRQQQYGAMPPTYELCRMMGMRCY